MTDLILVNPPVTAQERYGTLAIAGSYVPPLGLCSLAAVARQAGCKVNILEAPALNWNQAKCLSFILSEKPKLVGFTATTSTFLSAATLADFIKEADSKIKIIVGGPHVSALPKETLQEFKNIDIVVVGEGEDTLLELLNALSSGVNLENVTGVAFRNSDSSVQLNKRRAFIPDLDKLPKPAWDLLPNFPQQSILQAQSVANYPSTSISTSRGCKGHCIFCDRRVFGGVQRAHSAGYVMELIEDLYQNYGVRDIQIEDDDFMLHQKRLIEICEQLAKKEWNLTWSCQARVDAIELDLLKLMKQAGCYSILYGIESGSQEILDLMGKDIQVEQMLEALALTKKAGILAKGFFIVGNFGETWQTFQETRKFVKKAKLDDISSHYLTPFPGSEAYRVADKYGKLNTDWKKMTYYHPVFIPKDLTKSELIKQNRWLYLTFFTQPKVIFSYLKRLRNLRQTVLLLKCGFALIKYLLSPASKE